MPTKQPIWKRVAQLGDINPFEYGGQAVLVDKTGVYPPECEVIEPHGRAVKVWRFILEDCTHINGVLSDNKYHPDKPAWFARQLEDVATFMGESKQSLIDSFISAKPEDRARAWLALGDYFGLGNLDQYPIIMSQLEAIERWNKHELSAG